MALRFRVGKVGVSIRLSNDLVLSSVLVICVIIGNWGPILRMVILLLVMRPVWNYVVLITIGPEAQRVYKILPGKSPLFRRFQHQTPFSEGGRGSPVWVKFSS